MNFEQTRLAAEEEERFQRLVAEKMAADSGDLTEDEFIAATVKAINDAAAELNPNHGELTYEMKSTNSKCDYSTTKPKRLEVASRD